MSKTTRVLGALLLTGAFGLSGSAFAAESAAAVAAHFDELVKSTKLAHESAKAGDKDTSLKEIKAAKQHYKELTGDASGKSMQDAIKRLSEAQDLIRAGDTAKGSEILGEVATTLEKLKASAK
jgi:polyhydroxyalkanoate synthesis regulator phasin